MRSARRLLGEVGGSLRGGSEAALSSTRRCVGRQAFTLAFPTAPQRRNLPDEAEGGTRLLTGCIAAEVDTRFWSLEAKKFETRPIPGFDSDLARICLGRGNIGYPMVDAHESHD